MTVARYFELQFPEYEFEDDDDYEVLESVELDTVVGEECKHTIDVGHSLLAQVSKATSDSTQMKQIQDIVVDVCATFIAG